MTSEMAAFILDAKPSSRWRHVARNIYVRLSGVGVQFEWFAH